MKSFSVIITAGGSGIRFGGKTKKQFLELNGKSLLQNTVDCFLNISSVNSIVVTLPQENVEEISSQFLNEKVHCVAGGKTRSESVYNGFLNLKNHSDNDIVLIHDAVRPLIDENLIERVVTGVQKYKAALPVGIVSDTIKQIDEQKDCVLQTIPRDTLRTAQTPQGFCYGLLQQAYSKLDFKDPKYTDESLLVEAIGQRVYTVPGSFKNIKITTPFDLKVAQLILNM